LAHRGRLTEYSSIIYETWEPNHDAKLVDIIEHMRNNVFICRFRAPIESTDRTWVGWCGIPAAEMDKDVARYFHQRTKSVDSFDIAKVSMGTTFEDHRGIVRRGSVVAEDYVIGTYTSQAEFLKPGTASPWKGEVYVPKKGMPAYKLVDYEGERGQNVVASIETASEAQKAHEKESEATMTVVFSRRIRFYKESMLAELWLPNGEAYFEGQPLHILAYQVKGEDQSYDLQFRVRNSETHYCHFHGRMNKDLTHGRFHIKRQPITKWVSDLQFGDIWSDPSPTADGAKATGLRSLSLRSHHRCFGTQC
jgi:hypothetical protein